MDEVTRARLTKYATTFVDMYTETAKGHPYEAGKWATENIPDMYMIDGSEELAFLQETIQSKFDEKGWQCHKTNAL